MTENNGPTQDEARTEALTRVVERVSAWQETATDGTIEQELERGLREAGVTLSEQERERLVAQISEGADIDVSEYNPPEGGPA